MKPSRPNPPHLTRELIDVRFPELIVDHAQSMGELSDAEIHASLRETLAGRRDEDIWLFGYGSLMWKPDLEYADRKIARVRRESGAFRVRRSRSRG